jgi:hypothetical protein
MAASVTSSLTEVSFVLAAAEFEETQPIVEVIFGIREPDCDELGFDGPL